MYGDGGTDSIAEGAAPIFSYSARNASAAPTSVARQERSTKMTIRRNYFYPRRSFHETLFPATLRSSASVPSVINTLQLDEEVDYAHEPAERRPE